MYTTNNSNKKLKTKSEYIYTFEDDVDGNCMPIITLEVLSDSSRPEFLPESIVEVPQNNLEPSEETGVHFLSEKSYENSTNEAKELENPMDPPKARNDFLEYMTRNDGSVICKHCGEVLQSRTHWYRHKYKLHVQPLNPTPLFQCEQCLLYFKSRKGYIGHIASRHSDVLKDSCPVLTNSQAEALSKPTLSTSQTEIKEETDPEIAIPKSSVPNYQNNGKQKNNLSVKAPEIKKTYKNAKVDLPNESELNWEERRLKEEKLVADIIDRVRRECEALGSGGASRRGYTRRTTVMNT